MKGPIEIEDGAEYEVVLRGRGCKINDCDPYLILRTPNGSTTGFYPSNEVVISITKVEPPVVTFYPGQVVRKRATGATYTIGSGGYIHHPTGFVHDGYREFTSADYELVEFK